VKSSKLKIVYRELKVIDKFTALDIPDNAYPSFEDPQTVRLNQISTESISSASMQNLSDDAPLSESSRVSAGAKL
jgi:hypothetical protein